MFHILSLAVEMPEYIYIESFVEEEICSWVVSDSSPWLDYVKCREMVSSCLIFGSQEFI
jgi:hypothetical protein